MKYAIGIMACIAIAFLFITSPDRSQSHAQEEVAAVAPVVDDKLDSIIDLLHNQDIKIDQIDSLTTDVAVELEDTKQRLVKLETAAEEVPTPAPVGDSRQESPVCNCDCDCEAKLADHDKRLAALEADLLSGVAVSGGSTGGPVISYGSTGGPVISSGGLVQGPVIRTPVRTVASNVVQRAANVVSKPSTSYSQRWFNYDGLSRTDHAIVAHGLDTSGKTAAEISAQLDADHDTYGKDHGPILAARSRSMPVQSPDEGNCPGGVCPPRGSSIQSRSNSSNGWYLGKNLGRKK